MKDSPARVALQQRDAGAAVRQENVHRDSRRNRPYRREHEFEWQCEIPGQSESMTLIVGRGTVVEPEIIRIEGTARKRDLIIIRIVERFRQRVRDAELIAI